MCAALIQVFDLGGVVLDSPFLAIATYEEELQLKRGMINQIISRAGEHGAFQRLERGEIDVQGFAVQFAREAREAGVPNVSGIEFLNRIKQISPRPHMLLAIQMLRDAGYMTAALTNNFQGDGSQKLIGEQGIAKSLFDEVVESCKVGVRKPNPRIYEMVSSKLGVQPADIVYLDDIGGNLKPAAKLGMHTIHVAVKDPSGLEALKELQSTLGVPLLPNIEAQTIAIRKQISSRL